MRHTEVFNFRLLFHILINIYEPKYFIGLINGLNIVIEPADTFIFIYKYRNNIQFFNIRIFPVSLT